MSIIIKGLNIPKASNEDCVAVIRSNGKVEVWQTGYKERTVEAIQIPKPHGRLIDRDDIYIGRWDIDSDLAEQIQNAPTILEAED